MASLQQHFILTMGRSGSNTLVNAMNQHPNILNYGEVLGDWNTIRKVYNRLPASWTSDDAAYLDALLGNRLIARGLNGYRNLSYLRRRQPADMKSFGNIQSIGIKEFSLNLTRRHLTQYLETRPDIRVIGLQRSNVLDRFISWQMLEQTGVVKLDSSRNTPQQNRQIRLDTTTLLEDLRTIQQENDTLAAMLEALPAARVHRISYDDLYGDLEQTQALLRGVFEFLDLPAFTPSLRQRKILKGSTLDRIENLEACRSALQGTEFAALFAADSPSDQA